MRIVYRASFALGAPGHPGPDRAAVVQDCLEWIFNRPEHKKQRPPALEKNPFQDLEPTAIGDGATIETACATDGETDLWGVCFTHTDRNEAMLQWQTDVLLRTGAGVAEHFTCVNRFGSARDSLLPAIRKPSEFVSEARRSVVGWSVMDG